MAKNEMPYKTKKTAYKRIIAVIGIVTILCALFSFTASASASGTGDTYRVLYCPDYMTNVDTTKTVTTVCDVPSNIVIDPGGYNYNWQSTGTDLYTGQTWTLSSYLVDGEPLVRQYNDDTFRSTFSTSGDGFDGVTYVWKDTTYNQSLYGCTISPRSTDASYFNIGITAYVAVIFPDNTFDMRTVQVITTLNPDSYISMYRIHQLLEQEVQSMGWGGTIWRTINNQQVCYTQSLELTFNPRNANNAKMVDNSASFRETYDYSMTASDSRAYEFFSNEVIPPVEFGILDWVGSAVGGVLNAPLFYIGGSVPFTIGTALMVILGLGIFGLFMKLYAGG